MRWYIRAVGIIRSKILHIATLLILVSTQVFAQAAFETKPMQANVAVKVVEFQTVKGQESGLSAYMKNLNLSQAVRAADMTFPSSTAAGITIFLDQLGLTEQQLELVLQALVDENRAYILSRPNVMVMTNGEPTSIQTGQKVPYESNVIAGNTPVQVTKFKDTGVILEVRIPKIIDDDGDWSTTEDTFLQLDITAEVKEEGQRITVALDDALANGGLFSSSQNALRVPEFINRRIKTTIWIRHGQVLVLGGLYRDVNSKDVTSLPWLAEAEGGVMGIANKLSPDKSYGTPISDRLGNRKKNAEHRELVFLLKAESWYAGPNPSLMQTDLQEVSEALENLPKVTSDDKKETEDKD